MNTITASEIRVGDILHYDSANVWRIDRVVPVGTTGKQIDFVFTYVRADWDPSKVGTQGSARMRTNTERVVQR